MDDEQRQHLEKLRETKTLRLRLLEQPAALTGLNTRPEIQIEIDTLRTELAAPDARLAPPLTEPPRRCRSSLRSSASW